MPFGNTSIPESVASFQANAPSGFALAFHINFTTPRLLFQTYSPEWVRYYSENGLVMSDPTVLWGFENDGTKRWSELADLDSAGVLVTAKNYGMAYGLTCAITLNDTRTIGSFARPDREYSDDEIATLKSEMEALHKATAPVDAMTAEITAKLNEMNVQVQAS